MSVEVRPAGPEDMPAAYDVRYEVFVVGQDVPVELERDDLDAGADHVVALRDGRVVGTARLVSGRIDVEGRLEPGTPGTVGTVGRMAVLEPERGTGTGARLLAALEEQARRRGLPEVELHAQVHARGFYERAGYAAFGEIYLEAGIEHVGMRKPLR